MACVYIPPNPSLSPSLCDLLGLLFHDSRICTFSLTAHDQQQQRGQSPLLRDVREPLCPIPPCLCKASLLFLSSRSAYIHLWLSPIRLQAHPGMLPLSRIAEKVMLLESSTRLQELFVVFACFPDSLAVSSCCQQCKKAMKFFTPTTV